MSTRLASSSKDAGLFDDRDPVDSVHSMDSLYALDSLHPFNCMDAFWASAMLAPRPDSGVVGHFEFCVTTADKA
jgi:hypothetical protein